ncbi:DUF4259 domain-containing protein [Actinacidiphila glaucinigra]|uniref:DUF4259 domain-containing protein n=1 Tax=Actinacidiphila glaucinigra TaxID=235986 RepID=UPI003792BBD2
MGTWATGPFDNDTAADFACALDDATPEDREALIRGVLTRTGHAAGYLAEAEEAVAAAALIAAQCPGGEPVDTSYGPETPMPTFPSDLRTLADEALARIVRDESGLSSDWVDPREGRQWRATLDRLRSVLAPPPPTLPIFGIEP